MSKKRALAILPILGAVIAIVVAAIDGVALIEVPWLALICVFAGYESAAIDNDAEGDTLSEVLRTWFRTKSTGGKITFTVISVGFLAWFIPHIIY